MESEPQKKLTSQDKAKIIAERADAEKRREENEKKLSEIERKKAQSERNKAEQQRRQSNADKAEQIRREQMKQARLSQDQINNEGGKRKSKGISLKETDNVRSKVSQKKKKIKRQADEYFGENH